MAERYSGAWSRRTQADTVAPLKPGIDPEHLDPTDNPEWVNQPPGWVSTVDSPILPDEMYPMADPPMPTGEGPIDYAPQDHSYGMGFGPGLSVMEAQDLRSYWHSQDDGSYAAGAWQAMVDRDGQPHLEVTEDGMPGGDSPQTLQYERTGVGQPNDPDARVGKRFKRWYDRYIDYHRYDTDRRPLTPVQAYTAQPQPPVPNGTQLDSPYHTAATGYWGPPDRFVAPQMRRVPGDWAEPITTDATDSPSPVGFGLTQYGL